MSVYLECDDCGNVVKLTNAAMPNGWTGTSPFSGITVGHRINSQRCKGCNDAIEDAREATLMARREKRQRGRSPSKTVAAATA